MNIIEIEREQSCSYCVITMTANRRMQSKLIHLRYCAITEISDLKVTRLEK